MGDRGGGGRGREGQRVGGEGKRTNYVLSQIVETDTASLEFFRKFLRFTPHTFVLTVMCPHPPQC